MATLTNLKIKDTYDGLLKLSSNDPLTSSLQNIEDGVGNASPIFVSTSDVKFGDSILFIDGSNSRIGVNTTPTFTFDLNSAQDNIFRITSGVSFPVFTVTKSGLNRIIKIGDVDNEGGEFLLELSDSNAKFIAGGSNSVLINSTGLGIGVSSLLANFDVDGSMRQSATSPTFIKSSTAASDAAMINKIQFQRTGTEKATLGFLSDSNTIFNVKNTIGDTQLESNSSIVLRTNGVDGFKITNDQQAVFSGTVAIGKTTLPTTTLDIEGNTRTTGYIFLRHSADESLFLDANSTNGGFISGEFDEEIKFKITSNGVSYINGGNLAVGQTTASEKLEVNGNIKLSETAATTDTDKFVVLDSGVLKYRTGEELKSDIGTEDTKSIVLTGKNETGSTLTAGSVVCFDETATPPSGNLIPVKLADNNGTNTMPAIGVLPNDINDDAEGDVVMTGRVSGIDTSSFSVGDELFVSDTAGGMTTTKPTGAKFIQKIAVVVRVHASNGTIEVFGAGRVNDVPTPIYVDHTNQRVGIVQTNPAVELDVSGNIKMTETAATTDTDKFVVLDSGVLKYRTGSQVISDLPTDTRYVAVTGDTMTGNLTIRTDINTTLAIGDNTEQADDVLATTLIDMATNNANGSIRLEAENRTDSNDDIKDFELILKPHSTDFIKLKHFEFGSDPIDESIELLKSTNVTGNLITTGLISTSSVLRVTGSGDSYISNGSLGIGITNPARPLHIHQASNSQMQFTDDNSGSGSNDGLRVGWNGTVGQMYLFENADLRFATNNSPRMLIKANGNVQLNSYGSGGITGTTAYNLAVDSSGNIIENSANTRSVFVATSTDTTTNINATTTIQWNSEDIKDSGYTHSDATNPEQITITQAGTYKIYAAITYTTTVERANVALQILVNDVATGARGAGGYVRSQSSHNDGTTIVEDYVTVSANDVIKIQTSQEAASGTVNLRSGESKIIIEKLTGLTLSTTDANTLGGLGATDFVAAAGDTMTGTLTINEGGATIKKTGASQSTVLTIEQLADVGSSQDLVIKTAFDRDVGIKFETAGGINHIYQDSNGDDALIFSTGGYVRTTDAALILHQNQNVEIPNGNATFGSNVSITGNVSAANLSGTNTGDQVLPTDFVSAANGGTFNGDLTVNSDFFVTGSAFEISTGVLTDFGGETLSNIGAPLTGNDATTKTYVDDALTGKVSTTGDTMTGQLEIALASNQLKLSTGTAGDGYLNIGHFSNGTFIGTYGDDGGVADIIRFGTHSGDERMRITSGGDVALYETLQFFDDSSTPSASAFIHRPTSNTLALGVNSSNRIQINTDSILFNTDSKTGIDTSTTANNGHFILNGMGYVLDPDVTGTTGRLAYTISPSSYQPSIKSGTDKNVTSGGASADGSFPNTAADSAGFASETEFTFADAIAGLQGDGARLPRLEEVTAMYGRGTGDGTDTEYMWTQTFGPKGRVYQVKGNFGSYPQFRLVDPNNTNNTARVRRFFDISKANLPVYYDNDAKINVKEIRAEHSDGLKLTDESGNLGVFVEDGGAVGIGTNNPDRQFEVYGTNDGYMKLDGGRTGNHGFTLGSDTYGFIIYDDTASDYRFVIDQDSGNVGIGTTNPVKTLDVDGNGLIVQSSGDTVLDINAQNLTFSIGDITGANSNAYIASGVDTNLDFFGDGHVRFRNIGNVGIGVTSPSSILDISDAITGDNSQFRITNGAGATLRMGITGNGANQAAHIKTNSSENLEFHIGQASNSATPKVIFTADGDVGIGTDSPNAKLHVQGVVKSKQYVVPNTSGSGNSWVKLGRFTAFQGGTTIKVCAYLHSGYNAANSQDFFIEIYFKTSNGSSTDANGFAGNSWYYSKGLNTWDVQPKWVANAAGTAAGSYELFILLPSFTQNSYYTVEHPNSSDTENWLHIGNLAQADPGVGSSTVLIASSSFNILNTNVGIGTSSPDVRFSVVSASANSSAARIGGIEYGGNQRGLTIKTFQSAGGDDCGVEFNAAEGLAGYGSFIFKADISERLRILSTGGLTFNGDTSSNNALDDYEEGTFTPSLTFTGTETSGTTSTGRYTKIGDIVTVTVFVKRFVSEDNTCTLQSMSNLPFTSKDQASFANAQLRGTLEHDSAGQQAGETFCRNREGTTTLYFRKANGFLNFVDDETNIACAQITYEVN